MSAKSLASDSDLGKWQFRTTHWSAVLAARNGLLPESERALGTLCQTYWYPVYAFVRRKGHSHHEAEDLTQGFFVFLLSKEGFQRADRSRGRLRSFLLTSLRHFLTNEWARRSAARRGGKYSFVPWHTTEAEGKYLREAAETQTPERAFERNWALSVLDSALALLRSEYERAGKAAFFDALQVFLSGTEVKQSYSQAAAHLNVPEGTARVCVHRLRRRYGELLRQQVAQTVGTSKDVGDELRCLMSALNS
ncbi:MAG: sigma-70 family RNA polymerase sigma factor [Verrucomicrobia subdivision 3 bacterium]|nr:sigma-70 family RNA polymerase sigma factor [Limisphaerales bacterium]